MSRHHNINGNIVPFTAAEEAEWDANEKAHAEAQAKIIPTPAYVSQRASNYPSIGDQLDMLWHTMDKDNELQHKYYDFYQTIKKVKVDYPKK
tara:strand:+ start:235 stop:510 length:276 start_codon:yes stop_codon:yes gene_type:complete